MPHRHLQRSESSPRNAEHPHVSVRPRLMRQPRNYLLSIHLLLLRIFALRRRALTRTESANIHAHTHTPAPRKISMLGIISRRGSIILAVRQIFQQGGELLSRLGSVGHVERSCQPHAVFHRNPSLLHAHSVSRRRRRLAGETGRRYKEKRDEQAETKNTKYPTARRSDQRNLLNAFVKGLLP